MVEERGRLFKAFLHADELDISSSRTLKMFLDIAPTTVYTLDTDNDIIVVTDAYLITASAGTFTLFAGASSTDEDLTDGNEYKQIIRGVFAGNGGVVMGLSVPHYCPEGYYLRAIGTASGDVHVRVGGFLLGG